MPVPQQPQMSPMPGGPQMSPVLQTPSPQAPFIMPATPPAYPPISGDLGQLLQGPPENMIQANVPPKDEEELAQREKGWMDIFDRIENDPNMQQMLLVIGANLMQPIQPGQSPAGQIGKAALAGMEFMNSRKAAEAEAAMKDRELGVKETEAGVKVAQEDRERGAQPFADDLKSAMAEYYRTKRDNEKSGKGAGSAKLAYYMRMAQAMKSNHPDKFPTIDAALEKFHQLEKLAAGMSYQDFLAKFVKDNHILFKDKEEALEAAKTFADAAGLQSQKVADEDEAQDAAATANPNDPLNLGFTE